MGKFPSNNNTYHLLSNVLTGDTLKIEAMNNTYEVFKAIYDDTNEALRVNVINAIPSGASYTYTKVEIDALLAAETNTGVSYTKAQSDANYLSSVTFGNQNEIYFNSGNTLKSSSNFTYNSDLVSFNIGQNIPGGDDYSSGATGEKSSILGGGANSATGDLSVVVGGYRNTASGYASTASGYMNTASGKYSFCGGGQGNTSSGNYSGVIGSNNSIASGNYSAIIGGNNNTAQSANSVTIGGNNSNATGAGTVVIGCNTKGGTENYTTYVDNLISFNQVKGATITGSTGNFTTANITTATILGGTGNFSSLTATTLYTSGATLYVGTSKVKQSSLDFGSGNIDYISTSSTLPNTSVTQTGSFYGEKNVNYVTLAGDLTSILSVYVGSNCDIYSTSNSVYIIQNAPIYQVSYNSGKSKTYVYITGLMEGSTHENGFIDITGATTVTNTTTTTNYIALNSINNNVNYSTNAFIVGGGSNVISGKTNVNMLGCSGVTASADNTTYTKKVEITDATTTCLTMTDVATGGKYNVYISGGTWTLVAK